MRLPTVNQYKNEISTLSRQFDAVEQVRRKVGSGKQIQSASENPLLASKISTVGDYLEKVKGYKLNGSLAGSRNNLVTTNIQQGLDTVLEIKDLIKNAQNDTLSNKDRYNLAADIQMKLDRLIQIANTQDSNDEYIFSGMSVKTQPYQNQGGAYVYQGAQDATHMAIGLQSTTPYNYSGFRVFGDIQTGNGIYSISSDGVNNTGTGVAGANGVVPDSVYIPDEYRIVFVTNDSGELAYQVIGASLGQIIPQPPLNTPGDAPAYVGGSDLTFNGINIKISGQPNDGDVFIVSESTTQNMFETLQNVINTLKTPINSDRERANLHQALGDQALSVNQVFNHLNSYLTDLGLKGKNIDDQNSINKQLLVDQEVLFGKLSDVDMGEVISDLTQRLTLLEVTQQSYLQIQETFNRLLKR